MSNLNVEIQTDLVHVIQESDTCKPLGRPGIKRLEFPHIVGLEKRSEIFRYSLSEESFQNPNTLSAYLGNSSGCCSRVTKAVPTWWEFQQFDNSIHIVDFTSYFTVAIFVLVLKTLSHLKVILFGEGLVQPAAEILQSVLFHNLLQLSHKLVPIKCWP